MSSWVPEGREPPTTAAIATAAAILAATAGYFIGQASSLGLFGSSPSSAARRTEKKRKKKDAGAGTGSWPNDYDVTVHPDSSDEELMEHLRGGKAGEGEAADSEDEDGDGEEGDEAEEAEDAHGELKTFAGRMEECKLVLCVRTDLGMGKGRDTRSVRIPRLNAPCQARSQPRPPTRRWPTTPPSSTTRPPPPPCSDAGSPWARPRSPCKSAARSS